MDSTSINMDAFVPYIPTTSYGRVALGSIALGVAYLASLAIYRLFFSPLAGFPGPKLAAVTGYYESYYDIVLKGQYVFKIKEMHEKYGPVIRLNPHEISIDDPEYYDEVYVAGSKRRTENYSHFAKGIDFDGSHFLTTDHDLHRQRRKPLEPYFSRLGVSKLEPTVHELVSKLIGRFEALKGTRSVIRVDHAFSAFSGDVVGKVCCENSSDFLGDPNFAPHWFNLLHAVVRSIPLFMGFPFIIDIVSLIPQSVLTYLDPRSNQFNHFKDMAKKHIADAKYEKTGSEETAGRPSLFRQIFNSGLPESELSVDRVAKEAQVMLGAGTASTARTLDFILYYILANDHIRSTLREELREIMAEYPAQKPSWADLEKLPYLQAIIKEGLRLSYGVMHRLPRVSPDAPLVYKQWTIPAGVPVGMSAYMMHTDSKVYEKPFEFIPERWLGDVSPLMKRNLVPFSRGSRNCLGMNLAYAEMNFLLSALLRPNGPAIDLFETDESDVIQAHDFLIPLPKLTTKGVRVLVH